MPWSLTTFDHAVRSYVLRALPDVSAPILDVGAGAGKYARLLPEYRNIDAVEIFEPYIERFGLNSLYRKIYVGDVRDIILSLDLHHYPLVILGDVLEHLAVGDAQPIVHRIIAKGCLIVVVVPYLYPQGQSEGNVHESHLQPDLTPEVMRDRFPGLMLLECNSISGVYGDARTLGVFAELGIQLI